MNLNNFLIYKQIYTYLNALEMSYSYLLILF